MVAAGREKGCDRVGIVARAPIGRRLAEEGANEALGIAYRHAVPPHALARGDVPHDPRESLR